MTTANYDAVIVGARVAGAATGMLLARAGMKVLVLDRGRYGSDTLSTHALMRAGVVQLSRWGLLGEIVDAGTPPVRRTVMRYGDVEEVISIKPKPGADALYAPRRTVLDRILVDAAARAGADVRFGTTVTGLRRTAAGDRVTGVEARDRHGRPLLPEAPITVGADGAGSLVARAAGARTYHTGRFASAFLVGWFSGVEADGYQWLYGYAPDGTGRSGGIIPTNDGRVCAWAGVPATLFAQRRPDQHLAETLRAIAPDWADRVAASRRHGPVRGFPGRRGHLRQAWGAGWALAGDAGCFKDPLSTHGMTEAFRDAELLARAIVAGAGDPVRIETGLPAYETARDQLSTPLATVSDRLASYRWSMPELRDLLLRMSAGMREELAHLDALPQLGAPVPVPAG